ncbi:hypothetical protein AA0616_1602 [Komagataeibacter nataicola NRIC 0616]|nr:hypothetical protein AA15973_2741 [Komagataeibacter sucrofermentans DSM 15973]GBR19682.1 hypothetical protein AA0616_1602 [Komagataeibacter nataicola NRIC 0616]
MIMKKENNTSHDDITYFDMRVSHLSRQEKKELLKYIEFNKDDASNIDVWLAHYTHGIKL